MLPLRVHHRLTVCTTSSQPTTTTFRLPADLRRRERHADDGRPALRGRVVRLHEGDRRGGRHREAHAVARHSAHRHHHVARRRSAGTGTTMLVALQLVGVAAVPLNFTVLVPCVAPKFVPVIVTDVPTGPESASGW